MDFHLSFIFYYVKGPQDRATFHILDTSSTYMIYNLHGYMIAKSGDCSANINYLTLESYRVAIS